MGLHRICSSPTSLFRYESHQLVGMSTCDVKNTVLYVVYIVELSMPHERTTAAFFKQALINQHSPCTEESTAADPAVAAALVYESKQQSWGYETIQESAKY